MLKKLFPIAAIFIIGMVGGIFANQIFWPYLVEKPLFYQYNLSRGPIYLTETKEIFIQENTALVSAIEKAEKTAVGVRTQTQAGKILEGSGLIVTSDGLMVTLAELVPVGSNLSFFIDGKTVSFQVLKRDLNENLALIKISDSTLATASFARLEKLKIGERFFLTGVIFKNNKPLKTANEGIIKFFTEDHIQTNIIESFSIAGSPVFNIEGEVLGICTVDAKGSVGVLPISKIREFIGM